MKRVKCLLSYVLVLSMCFTLFSVPVFAEASYVLLSANQVFIGAQETSRQWAIVTNKDTRFVLVGGVWNLHWIPVSTESFQVGWNSYYSGGSITADSNSSSITINGNTYYYYDLGMSTGNVTFNAPRYTKLNNYTEVETAIYYTYGDGAVDPETPIDWGKPANVMYNTRIAGSGSASENNIDRIVWSPEIDSNANQLPSNAKVELRAVPGSYAADTQQNLLLKTYNDFILDHSKQYTLYNGPASLGRIEFKWGEIVDHFNFFPYSWVPDIQLVDDYYLKMGWIYQMRLIIEDEEYESDWINVYTATSSGVEPSEVITHSDDLTQQLVENILIINNLNETNTVNWQINDTTINNSTYNEPGEGEKPWWAYLLEAIVSLLNPNDETNIVINNTNNENQDLNNKLNEYNQIEDQQITNLNNSLEDITVESSMLSDSKFVSSAQWVAQQYNRMTTGTVIGSLIGFSLLFGLALIFIGKIR